MARNYAILRPGARTAYPHCAITSKTYPFTGSRKKKRLWALGIHDLGADVGEALAQGTHRLGGMTGSRCAGRTLVQRRIRRNLDVDAVPLLAATDGWRAYCLRGVARGPRA